MLEIGNQVVWWMTPANFFTVKGFNSGYHNKSIWAHHLINNTAFSLFPVCIQKSSTLNYDSKFVTVVVVLSVFFLKTGGSLSLMLSHFLLTRLLLDMFLLKVPFHWQMYVDHLPWKLQNATALFCK